MTKILRINLSYPNPEDSFNKFFADKKNKYIDSKTGGVDNYMLMVIYEEVDDKKNDDKEVKNIKDFIIETVHEEVKSIRDIFQSFIDLKK